MQHLQIEERDRKRRPSKCHFVSNRIGNIHKSMKWREELKSREGIR